MPIRYQLTGDLKAGFAVLFDRDGTLVHDVPYNGNPERVYPMRGARGVLAVLRHLGVPVGVVSNQSGVGRGLIDAAQVQAVNSRIEELLGPFDVWEICPHHPEDACACRKPKPGLILSASRRLDVNPHHCVVIGDQGSDIEAARAVGAHSILVPTAATPDGDIDSVPEVAEDLWSALARVMMGVYGERWPEFHRT